MNITYFKEQFDQLQLADKGDALDTVRQNGFNAFSQLGIPTSKHEEWKYTRIGGLFNKEYFFPKTKRPASVSSGKLDAVRLPGHEQANELIFVNGVFSFELSTVRSSSLVVLPLEEAAQHEYAAIVAANLGHSARRCFCSCKKRTGA
jgi:Fe-S cluster assembly protein SufD